MNFEVEYIEKLAKLIDQNSLSEIILEDGEQAITMKREINRSIGWTFVGFIMLIIYCLACLIDKFSYLDLSYLLVVVVYFTLFFKKVFS